ncbi:LysR family transcriptional regulator [Peribacillus frigoritolerans]|jgi:DNA-binding transcriptional LysR family regulator|uniref:LysR family transcriptional regulator n=1 Tax=Peribacillus frigoritolerans TaxID=450367 RepID=UPI00227F5600|nr:LysR family transcriptional regulator [Peribacillus frigoritolerans]MCY9140414.1 LysR family transcriptional regulator [Peribacillus frigoritolerans]
MDLRQLRYFTAIAQEKQITRAAKKLHMAQPPLSHQLKLLEQELGVLLMERNGKEMVLTESGEVLYIRANELLKRLEETEIEVKEVGDGLIGSLAIGTVKTCFSYIPERLRLFRKEYPLVTFNIKSGDSFLLAQYLRNREIDLALVRLPIDMNDFSFLPLPTDKFVLVIPSEWDLPKSMKMVDTLEIPLMLLQQTSGVGLYELVVDEYKKRGLELNIICECPDAAILLFLVREGVGATLLPESTLLSFPLNGLKIIEIEDCIIESKSAVVWLKDRYLSKSAKRFIDTFNPTH